MAHVCEDDGSATTFVAASPHAVHAPVAAPKRWTAWPRAGDGFGDGAPRLERADQREAERLKPAA